MCNLNQEATEVIVDKDKNGHERLKCKTKMKNNMWWGIWAKVKI